MRRAERIVDLFSAVLALIAAAAVLVILATISADVIRRDLTGRSIVGVLEIAEVLMVVLIFLGLAEAQRRDYHVSVELFTTMLPPRLRRYVEMTGMAISVAFVSWMAYATWERALASVAASEYRFGLVAVPIWPARIAIPVGLAALLLQFLMDMYRMGTSAPELVDETRRRIGADGF